MEADQQIPKKLCKSRHNRMIDGVCGGIGEYFDVDPTIVRVLWVFLTLLGGSGLFLYIVAMIIMPVNQDHIAAAKAGATPPPPPDRKSFWGIVLILIGFFVLVDRSEWFSGFSWWSFSRTFLFPVSLIVIGLLFIYVHTRRQPVSAGAAGTVPPEPVRELRRSMHDKKICGVCGGIARYFGYDPTLIRIIFIFLVAISFGWFLLMYVILCLLMPEDKTQVVST